METPTHTTPSIDLNRLTLQVDLLTEAVNQLAICLLRGPCWGATGETEWQLDKARRLVAEAKSNSQQNSKAGKKQNDGELLGR